jgi:hypothetical protein
VHVPFTIGHAQEHNTCVCMYACMYVCACVRGCVCVCVQEPFMGPINIYWHHSQTPFCELLATHVNARATGPPQPMYPCLPFGGIHFQGSDFGSKRDVALAQNGMWLNPGWQAANGGDKRRDPNWLGNWLGPERDHSAQPRHKREGSPYTQEQFAQSSKSNRPIAVAQYHSMGLSGTADTGDGWIGTAYEIIIRMGPYLPPQVP